MAKDAKGNLELVRVEDARGLAKFESVRFFSLGNWNKNEEERRQSGSGISKLFIEGVRQTKIRMSCLAGGREWTGSLVFKHYSPFIWRL